MMLGRWVALWMLYDGGGYITMLGRWAVLWMLYDGGQIYFDVRKMGPFMGVV